MKTFLLISSLLLSTTCKTRDFNQEGGTDNNSELQARDGKSSRFEIVHGTALACAKLFTLKDEGKTLKSDKPAFIRFVLTKKKMQQHEYWMVSSKFIEQGNFRKEPWKGLDELPLKRVNGVCNPGDCHVKFSLITDTERPDKSGKKRTYPLEMEVIQKSKEENAVMRVVNFGGIPGSELQYRECPYPLDKTGEFIKENVPPPEYDREVGKLLARSSARLETGSSGGRCYEYVSYAMINSGLIKDSEFSSFGIDANYSTFAYDFYRWATKHPKVSSKRVKLVTNIQPQKAPKGAILVYEPVYKQAQNIFKLGSICGTSDPVAGHIEIAQGDGTACSDFCRPIPPCKVTDQVHVFIPVGRRK